MEQRGLGTGRAQAPLSWKSLWSRVCSEVFMATRVAESFIMFYLVPKFDKTSFTFHLEWQDCMWLCVCINVCITCFIDVIQKLRIILKKTYSN